MKTVSKADLRKAIVAAEASQGKHPIAARPSAAQQTRLQKTRRASEELASKLLQDAGFDLTKLGAQHDRREAELERMVARHKADAARLASRARRAPRTSIARRSDVLGELASRGDFFPHPTFTLDTPFLIWSTPLLELDSAAVPFGSWAKFRVATSDSGSQKVSFYFYWPNPYTDYAVIDAATFMSANGHLRAHAPWTIGVNTSQLDAWAIFGLEFGVPRDVWSPAYQTQYLGSTGAFGSTFTGGDVEGATVAAGLGLTQTMFAVPPGNVVVFEVALVIDYDNDSGNVEADFEHGDFQVTCPVVVFSLLNSPPG
jgi:hypothetical protein